MDYGDKILAVIVGIIYVIIIINIVTIGWEPLGTSQNITNFTYIPMVYILLIQ